MAAEIYLRFYEELNDYLTPKKRKREFAYPIERRSTVQQVLEFLNIPVSEVELILVNGSSADLSRSLEPGDRVSVYPMFESLDVKSILKIRREPLRRTKFIADRSLSRLASRLRSLGFDVLIMSAVELAKEEHRILLTTDPGLLRSGFPRIYVVQKTNPGEQLKEVLARFDLHPEQHNGKTDTDGDTDSD